MSMGKSLSTIALAAALGGLIVPAFARNDAGGAPGQPDQGMSMDHMGRGMMRAGMMSRGMAGGCSEMMQSMQNGGGRPNSQWQKHSPGGPDSGG